jgi:hypothetical protein
MATPCWVSGPIKEMAVRKAIARERMLAANLSNPNRPTKKVRTEEDIVLGCGFAGKLPMQIPAQQDAGADAG